ncbi:MAG TPA: hypothetical protein VGH20_01755, partial [Myxococcales bacterium]
VHLVEHPDRRAIVSLNIGLLTAQSPLPSFLLQLAETGSHESFTEFIRFFDDRLLHARASSLFPERDDGLMPGWKDGTGDRVRLLRLASPSMLHWLFRAVYPELEVQAKRATRAQKVPTPSLRLGGTTLGSGAPGGYALVPTGALGVTLFAGSDTSAAGRPWAVEAGRRLSATVLPLLAGTAFPLSVVLLLRDEASSAHLRDAPANPAPRPPASYLGYDLLAGESTKPINGQEQSRRIVLFNGMTAP